MEIGGYAHVSGESARFEFGGRSRRSFRTSVYHTCPDEPIQYLDILTSNDDSSVLIGEPAPDFVLPGLDGQNYTLSEQLGQPVLLIYFAAW